MKIRKDSVYAAAFVSFLLFSSRSYALTLPPYEFIKDAIAYLNQSPTSCSAVPLQPLVTSKDFVSWSRTPPAIKNASRAVRSICFCQNTEGTCGTFVSIAPGKVVTNQHVVESLLSDKRAYEKIYNHGRQCGWFLAVSAADGLKPYGAMIKKPIHLKSERSGWWDHANATKNYDHSRDIAVLLVPELKTEPYVKITDHDPKVGDEIWVAGYPMTNGVFIPTELRSTDKPAISSGHVSSVSQVNDSADFIGVNGMSGGATFNNKGEFTGIFWGKEQNTRDTTKAGQAEHYFDNRGVGHYVLPAKLPREVSYFIPATKVRDAIPATTVSEKFWKLLGY